MASIIVKSSLAMPLILQVVSGIGVLGLHLWPSAASLSLNSKLVV
jgi:hypothetical protein